MMQSSLAERLRVLRAKRGLGLVEAAEGIGIDRQTLRRLERGDGHPYFPTLRKISAFYDVSVEELIVAEEETAPLGEGPLRSPRVELVDALGHDYIALPVKTNMRDAEGMSLGQLLIRVGGIAAERDYLDSLKPSEFEDPRAAKAEIRELRRNFLPTIMELAEIAKRKHGAEVPVDQLTAKAS